MALTQILVREPVGAFEALDAAGRKGRNRLADQRGRKPRGVAREQAEKEQPSQRDEQEKRQKDEGRKHFARAGAAGCSFGSIVGLVALIGNSSLAARFARRKTREVAFRRR